MLPLLFSGIGILVATTALVISILNYLRDRPKLAVRYSCHWNDSRDHKWSSLTVMNIGRRPVMVCNFGYKSWSSGWHLCKGGEPNPPLCLKEAESAQIESDFPSFSELWDVEYFFIVDHIGKRWRVPGKAMQLLQEMTHNIDNATAKSRRSEHFAAKRDSQFIKARTRYLKWAKRNGFKPHATSYNTFDKPYPAEIEPDTPPPQVS